MSVWVNELKNALILLESSQAILDYLIIRYIQQDLAQHELCCFRVQSYVCITLRWLASICLLILPCMSFHFLAIAMQV